MINVYEEVTVGVEPEFRLFRHACGDYQQGVNATLTVYRSRYISPHRQDVIGILSRRQGRAASTSLMNNRRINPLQQIVQRFRMDANTTVQHHLITSMFESQHSVKVTYDPGSLTARRRLLKNKHRPVSCATDVGHGSIHSQATIR